MKVKQWTGAVEREVVPECLKFYYIINQAPGDALNRDEQFNAWMKDLVAAWGAYLDTPASAAGIDTFRAATNYNMDDYIEGPSGWQTFNQFFAREVKPGRRPVAEPRNDKVVVSPADAVFMGQWPIDDNSTIAVKGARWAIAELLDGSPYKDYGPMRDRYCQDARDLIKRSSIEIVAATDFCRRHRIAVMMGAPNIIRGGSHSGNVAAIELARAGTLEFRGSGEFDNEEIELAAEAGEQWVVVELDGPGAGFRRADSSMAVRSLRRRKQRAGAVLR